jgi:adenylosuccinate lyase
MIERYSRSEMTEIWKDQNRYLTWLKVELSVCEQLAHDGLIPRRDWFKLKKQIQALVSQGGVDPKRVDHFEKATRHDVIAFTTAVAERLGSISRYIHFGLTSSDVVDTSLSLMLQEAGSILRQDMQALLVILKKQALKYRDLPTIGRSHGVFAEPTSFGLKFLGWYCEWKRNLQRLDESLEGMRVGKLSGAVGVSAHWGPGFEQKVLQRLNLKRGEVSTQVIPRDRHAQFMTTLAICGSSLERIAVELRHLQRSEVGEILEEFKKGQKGSSAMPHKRNPISAENLSGSARLLRSYGQAGLENVALWHERDISHSSVERVAIPDATILLDYALNRMREVLERLVVRKDRVQANLQAAGATVFSGHFLLALVKEGVTREDAYAWVQSCAIASLEGKGEFIKLLTGHPEISRFLSLQEINRFGSMKYQLRHVSEIFRRAL